MLQCQKPSSSITDSVIRTIFYKYFHPKEALISNGVLNRALAYGTGKLVRGSLDDDENNAQLVCFVTIIIYCTFIHL